jgi:hypothetical protein
VAVAAGVLGGKKLRRLPHIDMDVSVEEDATTGSSPLQSTA